MSVPGERVKHLNDADATGSGPVVYWMQRDVRAFSNWALLYAQEQALTRQVPLLVLYVLPPAHALETRRMYDFAMRGLEETVGDLQSLSIPTVVEQGKPVQAVSDVAQQFDASQVVTDFNPLRHVMQWKQKLAESLAVPFSMVDAHNIVPCWVASDKEEFAAHTFRPKVRRELPTYLTRIPDPESHPTALAVDVPAIDFAALRSAYVVDDTVAPVTWLDPGRTAGLAQLRSFIASRLDTYDTKRNDPNASALSNLSPYLRHGQISANEVALLVQQADVPSETKELYLEELIVRRELTDNYCFYNQSYDQVAGAHAWAQKTIAEHATDEREHVYTFTELEQAKTHDDLWNAAQMQMVSEGKMHGWCRMYWAKKILEWTPDVQTAIDTALQLNDKYELDGNDPNGVVGVMWSICGVHDRAWTERPVFGKIRYMNYNGAKRKFDVSAYVEKYSSTKSTLFAE